MNNLHTYNYCWAKCLLLCLVASVALCGSAAAAEIVINEFQAVNRTTLADEDGDFSDWIELHNPGLSTVNLDGWSLTDEAATLDKWILPAVSLNPGDFLIVFASSKDRRNPSGELHTNFKLTRDGEYLALVQANGETIEHAYAPAYPEQLNDLSYGISSNVVEAVRYFANPTPGAQNAGAYLGLVEDTTFSVDRGFYSNAFQVAITTLTQNATIHYTLDGSTPTQIHGTPYTVPIPVTNTTTLRAMAWVPGYRSTDVDTQTYIYLEDTVRQSADAPGPAWPAPGVTVNTQKIDYEMDARVTGDPRYTNMIYKALVGIPTISIVTDLDNLFHPNIGIYVNSTSEGDLWERPVSAELIYPDGRKGFQEDAGLRIRGGASRNPAVPKHGFRLRFRNTYGASKLRFKIFGDDGPDASNGVDLRCSQTPGWHHFSGRSVFVRDIYARDLQIAQGQPSTRGDKYHLYLNGVYWGMYETQENIEQPFMAENLGGNEEDYDIISKKKHGHAVDGSDAAYRDLWEITMEGFTDGAGVTNYFKAQGLNADGVTPNPSHPRLLDITSLADYMLVHYFAGELDGMAGNWGLNNYICGINRVNPDGFKYFKYDSEWSLDVGFTDNVSRFDTSTDFSRFNALIMHGKLVLNEEYLLAFADQIHKHFFNDGIMTPSNAVAIFRKRTDEIDTAIVAESARWGDSLTPDVPKTRDDDWIPDVNTTVNWLQNRNAVVLGQLRNRGWYPALDAPAFSQHGGAFSNGFQLSMSGPTDVYYTLDGTDPREILTGAVQGTLYSGAVPLNHSVLVKARTFDGSNWSALNKSVFAITAPSTLALTELMYHPRDPQGVETNSASDADAFEFIELQNTGGATIGLAGLHFTDGVTFDFTEGAVLSLDPGESVLVVSDLAAFEARYNTSGLRIAGEYAGALANGGERLTLTDANNVNVFSVTYNNARGWPLSATGAGHSLIPLVTVDQLGGLLDYGGHWRASGLVGGSPGLPDPAPGVNVTINEIGAHTDTGLAAPLDSDDWVELYNPSGVPVDVSGWSLSDDADQLQLYTLPATSVIPAEGFLMLTEILDFHTNRTDGSGFGLNKAGESVYLTRSTPSGLQVVDALAFKGQPNGVALGRYPDGAPYTYELSATTNAPNAAPQSHVLISELMVSPLVASNAPAEAASHEYVEILNPLGAPVDLWTDAGAWRLDGGIDYVFPTNTTLQSSEYVVVVSFDPLDSVARNDFLDSYGLTNGQVRLFGPYKGRLDNRTERVAIERPQEADAPGDSVSWIIVDEVIYFVDSPWPTGTDGTGASLQRSVSPFSGRDPGNWFAALEGTPGVPGTLLAIASPVSGSRYFVPDPVDVNVSVEALRVSNSVVQVEFFEGTNVLCVVTQAPYRCTLNVDEPRTYFLRAAMTDAAGVHTSRVAIIDGLQIEAYAATGISDVVAICTGALIGSGDANVAMYWGDEDGGEDAVSWDHIVSLTASGGSPIAVPLSGLVAGRTYYYRFRAQVEGRFAWSTNTVSFRATPLDSWSHNLAVDFPWAPASPLLDFPVLIKLHEGISGFSYSQFASVSGNDFRVGDGATGEALRYDIEHWNTGGVSYVWVQVPALTSNSSVNAYWGYAPAASTAPLYATDGSIWRDNYAAVWHLDDSLRDASSQQGDAVSTGSLAADGVVAGGRLFDGVDDVMRQGPAAAWYNQHMQDMTISVWAHPTAVGGVPFGAAVGGDITQDFGFWLNAHPFVRNLFVNIDGAVTQFGQFNLNEWCLLTLTVSNGVLFAAKNDLAPVQVGPVGAFLPTRQPTLGNLAGGDDPFTGRLDELRVSTTTRSAAWIRATYRTVAEHDAFTSYGTVVSGGPFVDADGNGLPDAWEVRHFGTAGIDEQGHGDADPMDNLSEYVAGTDPTNSADFFWLGIETGAVNPVFYFNTRLTAGEGYEGLERFYALEDRAIMSTGLWSHLPGADRIPATGTTFVYSNAVPATNTLRQYRSKVWLEDAP